MNRIYRSFNLEYRIDPEDDIEKSIVNLPFFSEAMKWGFEREGHPEKITGLHVEGILTFIDRMCQNYTTWNDIRQDLRLLAMLHDISKFEVKYENGVLMGNGHNELSKEVAVGVLGGDHNLLRYLPLIDKYFGFYRDHLSGKKFNAKKFSYLFGQVDLGLLVRFNYADSCQREKESVKWFEDQARMLGLISEPIYVKEPKVLERLDV